MSSFLGWRGFQMDMTPSETSAGIHAEVVLTLRAHQGRGFQHLRFPAILEARFEEDTRAARAYRLWLEGLIAIIVFNLCLLLDYLLVGDATWQNLVLRTSVITPLSLIVNLLMRVNPPKWLREGSVAAVMLGNCYINLLVQGNSSAAHALFGTMCMFITALFAGVVMRLRFVYAAASIGNMLLAGVWFITRSSALTLAEIVVGTSLMIMSVGIILIACYSMERQERLGYLLCLKSDLQAEAIAEANAELQRLSSLDKLTGLPNRRALEDRFSQLWFECAFAASPLAVIVIDVDHFKAINDVYGHVYGDEALRRIAELLPKALRGANDLAARFGGEEFVLLLPYANREVAMTVAERVRSLVETAGTPITAHESGQATMWATVSCGVSVCIPNETITTMQLLDSADRALYAAKRDGRNCVKFNECIALEESIQQLVTESPRLSPFLLHSGLAPRHSEDDIQTAAS